MTTDQTQLNKLVKQRESVATAVNTAVSNTQSSPDLNMITSLETQMNANLAEMIIELDKSTDAIGSSFVKIKNQTKTEKFVSLFSSSKAKIMMADRVRKSSVGDNLKSLVSQSQLILRELQSHDSVLKNAHEQSGLNIKKIMQERTQLLREAEQTEDLIAQLDPVIMELEEQKNAQTDNIVVSEIQLQIAEHMDKLNQLKTKRQSLESQVQSLEKYIKMHDATQQSLLEQMSTNLIFINKLKIDTEQRTFMYSQYETSLKTAHLQKISRDLNNIGNKTDEMVMSDMVQMGHASQAAKNEILDQHEQLMEKANQIKAHQDTVNIEFNEQLNQIMKRSKQVNH